MTRLMMIVLMCVSLAGCLSTQNLREGGLHGAGCAMSSAISCTIQAAADCRTPSDQSSGGWKGYALCIYEQSKDCQVMGLGKCAMGGLAVATGLPFSGDRFSTMTMMASGPSLCNVIEVKRCVADVTIESSQEALRAVASCYQTTCPLALE